MNDLPPQIEEMVRRQATENLFGRTNLNPNAWRSRYLFSTYLFAPGLGGTITAGDYELFVAVKGDQAAQGYADRITDRETNWEGKGGQIPDWQNLIVEEIGVDIRRPPSDVNAYLAAVQPTGAPTTGKVDVREPLNAIDVALLCNNALLKIKRGPNRAETIGRLGDYPATGGVYGGVQASRQTPQAAAGLAGTDITTDPNTSRAYTPVTRNAVAVGFGRKLGIPRILQRQSKFSVVINFPKAVVLQDKNGATAANNNATGAVEVCVALWCLESFPAQ